MIAVVGLGFVGLATALGFAEKTEHTVYCYDIDYQRREAIKNGRVPFYEPQLDVYLVKHLGNKFVMTETLEEAVRSAKVICFCVGTPNMDDGSADLSFLIQAVKDALDCIPEKSHRFFVVKSTVPPGTTNGEIRQAIESKGFKIGQEIGLANNPEFLREGCAWLDVEKPDRIVLGVCDKATGEVLESIYRSFNAPICKLSLNGGEFVKYMSNSLLATLVSFANEMSILADRVGDIDIRNTFDVLRMDKRWFGNPAGMVSYVYPGCGFGGYCLPKDVAALYAKAKSLGEELPLLGSVLEINNRVKHFIVEKIRREIQTGTKLGVLGVSFKPDSDDVRGTVALDIIRELHTAGYGIMVYDPMAMESFKRYNLSVEYAHSLENIVELCDNFVILTAWKEFIEKIELLKGKKVIDARYCLGAASDKK